MKKMKISIILAILVLIVIKITSVYSLDSEGDFVYLSDIPYIEDLSFADGSNKIRLDENNSDQTISLIVEGKETPFIKGVTAWATSEVVYNIKDYGFDYFTAYLGVDASETDDYYNTGVKFYIYVSDDGENWGNPVYSSERLDAWSEAKFVEILIKDVNYLKLVADDNSDGWWAAWYDEAVYANAKLIKEGYEEDTSVVDFIKPVEYYDEILKNNYSLDTELSGEYEHTLLKREFVRVVGYDTLQAFARVNEDYQNIVSWLMNDVNNLRLYIVGGTPDGSYVNSLRVLADLYKTYGSDLETAAVAESGLPLKDLYKKMMITLSLTHSADVGLWVTGTSGDPNAPNDSNALKRYAIYKKMHSDGLLETEIFESLEVEEMRFVMNNIIDDEEIQWLNAYSREKNSKDPYSYITYGFGYDYYESQYYDPNNYAMWDEKYHLSEYGLTYAQNLPKLWVVFEEGGVCGAISKTGSNLHGSYGVPSTVVGQPGHAAYIYYGLKKDTGEGIWTLYNDVSGWAMSDRTEKLGIRMPGGWGIGDYASGYPVTYILLAQANFNDFSNYELSEEILLLGDVYNLDEAKQEQIYRQALEVNSLNFEAWLNLVELYKVSSEKTEKDCLSLAQEVVDALTYYPLPMHDLLRILETKITTTEGLMQFTLLRTKALTTASEATSKESIQDFAVRQVANYLLGNIDSKIADFSFDGENAGQIILSEEKFGTSGVVWEYSLDGKSTWTVTSEHKHQLTTEEIAAINPENDLSIHIVGTNYDDENIYTIDILKGVLPNNLYNNDNENKVIGATDKMQWRYSTKSDWTLFAKQTPDLTGDKRIIVRVSSTGTSLYSDSKEMYFTEDSTDDTFKYITIDRLSIADVSTEEPGRGESATNVIDGNIYTMWHTLWNGSDNEKYITIKLEEPAYIAGLEYFQRQDTGSNGKVYSAKILVSEDGDNWTEVVSGTDWDLSKEAKKVVFEESIKAQYVKVIGEKTSGSYMASPMINLYEDITKIEVPEEPEPEVPEQPDPEEPQNPDVEDPKPETPEETLPEEENPESGVVDWPIILPPIMEEEKEELKPSWGADKDTSEKDDSAEESGDADSKDEEEETKTEEDSKEENKEEEKKEPTSEEEDEKASYRPVLITVIVTLILGAIALMIRNYKKAKN